MNAAGLSRTRRGRAAVRAARRLGWLSIGLGLAEFLMPRAVARATGLQGQEALLRLYGLREIAVGVGLLVTDRPEPWVWARVGGDALDAATLAPRVGEDNPDRLRSMLALGAVGGVAALDWATARDLEHCAVQAVAPVHDYSARRGLPEPPARMRGSASDFEIPPDMRTPQALRPYSIH